MKKILLILTGGTIGSVDRNGIIVTEANTCRALELYEKKYGRKHRFAIHTPINILSEELNTGYWETLINNILSLRLKDYDGMIITHGSDTLSYSSAMLGMCLNHLGIPVVITAANYVPDDPRSNALDNFSAAVRIIETASGGVYTVFKNEGDKKAFVYIPTRVNEADRSFDRFTSFDGIPLAEADQNGITQLNPVIAVKNLETHRSLTELHHVHLDKAVALIHPYPSLDYRQIVLRENTAAVLHITYHSATVSRAALTLLEQCRKKDIPMYLCSFKSQSAAIYETSDILLQNGALPLYDISTEAAYAKLLLAVNMYPDKIDTFMKQNIYFERKVTI